jgi:hypothetical protein
VIRSKRVLAERHAFESRSLREYMDFSKLENRILERRRASVRPGCFKYG